MWRCVLQSSQLETPYITICVPPYWLGCHKNCQFCYCLRNVADVIRHVEN